MPHVLPPAWAAVPAGNKAAVGRGSRSAAVRKVAADRGSRFVAVRKAAAGRDSHFAVVDLVAAECYCFVVVSVDP